MATDAERKRKLEQDQLERNSTTKRLKGSKSQAKSVEVKNTRDGEQNGSASPKVVVTRVDPRDAISTPKSSSKSNRNERKNSAKPRKSDADSIAGAVNTSKGSEKSGQATNGGSKPAKASAVNVISEAQQTPKQSAAGQPNATQTPASNRKSKKEKKEERRKSIASLTADTEMAGATESTPKHFRKKKTKVSSTPVNGAVSLLPTEEKEQRALQKKERRRVEREVGSGLRPDEAKTAPNENGWWLSPPSAGRYLDHDPIFVRSETSEECLIAATVRELQLLSLDTSLVIRTHIVPDGRSILCFSLSPSNDECVDIAYDNGTKVQWNWITSQIVKGTFPGQETTITMTTAKLNEDRSELFYITRSKGEYILVGQRKSLYKTSHPISSVQVLDNAAFVVCLSEDAIIVGSRKSNREDSDYVFVEIPTVVPSTCVDARVINAPPKSGKQTNQRAEIALAIGNAEGQIHLYTRFSELMTESGTASFPAPRVLHWHREPLSAVKFSRDGNYLISGGKETVLVLWQLETGKKQFLPHLTAEVERIVVSPNGTKYALQMGDNSIMVISTSELKAVANFAGLQLPVRLENMEAALNLPRTTALLHPRDPNQLLITVPSSQPKSEEDITTRPFLQLFDTRHSRHIARQALTRNNVTDFSLGPEQTPIEPPDVSHIAVSADGNWLATVDDWYPPGADLAGASEMDHYDALQVREQQLQRREVHLKFWRWNATDGIWTLSTRADAPHARSAHADLGSGAGRVLELKSDPASNAFATVGEDGCMKLWRPRSRARNGVPLKDENGEVLVEWVCKRSVPLHIPAEIPGRADSPMDDDAVDEILDDDVQMIHGHAETGTEIAKLGSEDDAIVITVTDKEKPPHILAATLSFSPDGSLVACGQVAGADNDSSHSILHFISTTTGKIVSSKTGLVAPDEELIDTGFLDRYFITLSVGTVRVWNLVDDSHHYSIALAGDDDDHEDAMLAINEVDETFAVVSTSPVAGSDALVPRVEIYSPRRPNCLFMAEFTEMPVALLTAKGMRGYTILFEDGTIRKVNSTAVSVRSGLLENMGQGVNEETAQPPPAANIAEAAFTPVPSAAETLALIQGKDGEDTELTGALGSLAFEEGEDDRPVVRPEQLASIFDVGQSFAMPPVADMFAAVVGLYGRKPRARRELGGEAMNLA
jgi:NET1-associated nuclear protein 1 (U3 small nucleolar RNA-associated protein 17)